MDFDKMMLERLGEITGDNQIIRTGDAGAKRPNTAFTDARSRSGTVLPHDDPRAYLMKRIEEYEPHWEYSHEDEKQQVTY